MATSMMSPAMTTGMVATASNATKQGATAMQDAGDGESSDKLTEGVEAVARQMEKEQEGEAKGKREKKPRKE